MVFHVFVDGVTATTTPDAVRALAHAIAAHYGVAADDLHARLLRGPFRVKANVDEATAHMYARDLTAIGARVRIEPGDAPVTSARPTRAGLSVLAELAPMPEAHDAPTMSARPTRSGLGVLPAAPARTTRTGLSALPPQPPARVPSRTGLSAPASPPVLSGTRTRPAVVVASAPATAAPVAALSALPSVTLTSRTTKEAEDIALALSALDTGDAALALLDSAPPPRATTGSFAPPPAEPARPTRLPTDMFEPPDQAQEE
ncbi:MAG TPA: hypothetical protein VFP84_24040, partial [Kofleriaceae bacterium]|nr:hypothetical protein [Kofleriaceae bacterium]